ncbi:Hypothetical predicted protein [Octopus vulgaris]|uniref:Uncharacterized protein n=1 Tax=Octopus vulgaris TaxID=6645 RepID=A0AA36BEP0_OCTVU|nr:Hypothetical predicted protein [Octopus vulgaris]
MHIRLRKLFAWKTPKLMPQVRGTNEGNRSNVEIEEGQEKNLKALKRSDSNSLSQRGSSARGTSRKTCAAGFKPKANP